MDRRQFLESAACTSALSAFPSIKLKPYASASAASSVRTAWEKPEFRVRGLEIHSRRMWQWASVSKALSLMEQLNLNMLVFHQDDVQDAVVWPDKYFPKDVRSARRAIQGAHDRAVFLVTAREYLRNVASEAKKRNIKFFIEVCEIWY
ncbi:MAG: hypothetical protein P4L50_00845, partial [Anaerolineaceae bacterium]|nr:hypothetical protein [Anaerolineaceae bacterium]